VFDERSLVAPADDPSLRFKPTA